MRHLAQVCHFTYAQLVEDLSRLFVSPRIYSFALHRREQQYRVLGDPAVKGEHLKRGDDAVSSKQGGEPRHTGGEVLFSADEASQHVQIHDRSLEGLVERDAAGVNVGDALNPLVGSFLRQRLNALLIESKGRLWPSCRGLARLSHRHRHQPLGDFIWLQLNVKARARALGLCGLSRELDQHVAMDRIRSSIRKLEDVVHPSGRLDFASMFRRQSADFKQVLKRTQKSQRELEVQRRKGKVLKREHVLEGGGGAFYDWDPGNPFAGRVVFVSGKIEKFRLGRRDNRHESGLGVPNEVFGFLTSDSNLVAVQISTIVVEEPKSVT